MPREKRPATHPSNAHLAVTPTSRRTGGRDDFNRDVRDVLAKRVGYYCSNPDCPRSTIGPRMSGLGVVSIGEAAHIKAASMGFARYDGNQSPEERSGVDDGIWLCASCHTLIDSDEKTFTVELLHRWKNDAEQRAAERQNPALGPARAYRAAEELAEQVAELRGCWLCRRMQTSITFVPALPKDR